MKILQRVCMLAGPFGLAVLLALPAGAQKTNSQGDQIDSQNSPAYQQGYRQGLKDREDNFEPGARHVNWNDGAVLPAYNSGYRAGYCHEDRSKTGYYNGIYGYGPPVIRNGYYGYNAPNPYCENNRGKDTLFYRGNLKAPQNRVEYGGGG